MRVIAPVLVALSIVKSLPDFEWATIVYESEPAAVTSTLPAVLP